MDKTEHALLLICALVPASAGTLPIYLAIDIAANMMKWAAIASMWGTQILQINLREVFSFSVEIELHIASQKFHSGEQDEWFCK